MLATQVLDGRLGPGRDTEAQNNCDAKNSCFIMPEYHASRALAHAIRPAMLAIDNVVVRIAGRGNPVRRQRQRARRAGASALVAAWRWAKHAFQIILGDLHADGGEVSCPASGGWARWRRKRRGRCQPDRYGAGSRQGTHKAAWLRREHESDGHRLGDIYHRLDAIDAYTAPSRAALRFSRGRFSAEDQIRPCREFFRCMAHCGWRWRHPVSALDPASAGRTHQLSRLEGVLWLENFLQRYRGTATDRFP